ncbi:hypothetical protein EPO15_15035 [bacterium]|nr:MAG: hypothetical protein EPO15_15035 [bacterium]
MLLAGLMAVHVGAFAAWLAAGTAEALLDGGEKAAACRRWALGAMGLALLAGALGMSLSYPFYKGEGWLWAKVLLSAGAVAVQLARAAGKVTPRRYLWTLGGLSGAALLLSFARPF